MLFLYKLLDAMLFEIVGVHPRAILSAKVAFLIAGAVLSIVSIVVGSYCFVVLVSFLDDTAQALVLWRCRQHEILSPGSRLRPPGQSQ